MNQGLLFNNEAIGLVALIAVLREAGSLPLEKAVLALPLLLHPPITQYLKRMTTNIQSIDALVALKPELVSMFNSIFHSNLITSINAIIIGNDLKLLDIEDGIVKYRKSNFLDRPDLGSRAKEIIQAAIKVSKIIEPDSYHLYFSLRVKL